MDGKDRNVELPEKAAQSQPYNIKPGFCCFGIIDDCFLRCKMCHKWKPDSNIAGIERAPVSSWKKAIASLKTITDDNFLINFGGGEPLLFEGLLELVRYAADKGFRTNIATNAYLIDEDMAKAIAGSGLSSVNLSLDSMNESTHDYLRGKKGVYKNVMGAVEYLDRYCGKEFEIIICCAIYDINMGEVVEVAEWVNIHPRIKWIYFMAAMQPNNTRPDKRWYGEYAYLWPKETERIVSVINRLIDMKNNRYKINNQICQLEAFRKYFSNPGRFVKKTACNLDRAVHISSIGNIYICYDWGCLGNIRKDDLAAVWYSEEADKVRKDIIDCRKNCHHLINCFFEGDYPFEVI